MSFNLISIRKQHLHKQSNPQTYALIPTDLKLKWVCFPLNCKCKNGMCLGNWIKLLTHKFKEFLLNHEQHIRHIKTINNEHIPQQMIKEFTPLLGYISWSSFPWIIFIMLKKVLLQCLEYKIDASNGSKTSKNP
jgi:hypothetical protein